jgi:predicted nuclease of restriction endonuclease-like RecB superfamily
MLTGKLIRVRYARERIVPCYLDTSDPNWSVTAERLLELFRRQHGRTRGELEEDLRETIGNDPGQLVHQGLAKLLEDRCEFEVVSGRPPEQLREAVFRAAAEFRPVSFGGAGNGSAQPPGLPLKAKAAPALSHSTRRERVLSQVATQLGMTTEQVEQGLFADLKSEQRLIRFKDCTAERILQRYNVALAQAVLLRSTKVHVAIRGESSQRYRQLFRLLKFRRLICEVERTGERCYQLHVDGPLSLFSATQKYGLQLALFLPAVLPCRDFELTAELRWGAQRKPKTFSLTPVQGLISHWADHGMYVPPELKMFVDLFRKKVTDWDVAEETEVLPLGDGYWVPDFRLVQRDTGKAVLLEVLGFWRRSSAERHLERLRQHVHVPFLLAVSEQLRIDDAELEGLPAGVHRFRQMPLPEEVARLARELVIGSS